MTVPELNQNGIKNVLTDTVKTICILHPSFKMTLQSSQQQCCFHYQRQVSFTKKTFFYCFLWSKYGARTGSETVTFQKSEPEPKLFNVRTGTATFQKSEPDL